MNNKKLDLVQLDERILFDVAPLDAQSMDAVEMPMPTATDVEMDWTQFSTDSESVFADIPVDNFENINTNQTQTLDNLELLLDEEWSGPDDSNGDAKQLIVVDQTVEDISSLLDMAIGQQQPELFEILLIDSSESALDRINQRLSGTTYSAVHILAHGQDGEIQLGNSTWDSTFLDNNFQEFSGWKLALEPEADLFIYGCNVAETELGQAFIQDLANMTGTDVAASTDQTGSSALQGDWDLEFKLGSFDHAEHAFDFNALDAWHYTLDIVSGNDMYTGTTNLGTAHDSVAVSTKGDYVVVWTDGSGVDTDIYAQQFNADGTEKAPLFRVNDLTAGEQANASVAIDTHGNFAVVWTDIDTDVAYAKTYFADGSVNQNEFTVSNNVDNAVVTMNNDGDWAVAWEHSDNSKIMAKTFNPDGSIRASAFDVASGGSPFDRESVSADMNKYGELAIAWLDDTLSNNVMLNKFDLDGNSITGEVEVANSFVPFYGPDVSINDFGDMVVSSTLVAFGNIEVNVSWIDADGTVADFDFVTPSIPGKFQYYSSIDMQADSGDFAVSYQGSGPGDSNGVFRVQYDEATDSFGSQVLVNTITPGQQGQSSTHYGGAGEILTVYSGQGVASQSTVFIDDGNFLIPYGQNDIVLDSTLVHENDTGAVIGNLVGVDPAVVDPSTFTTDDARFEVVNNKLKLVDGVQLDFETEPQIDVEISVEDAVATGTFHRTTYTIDVIDVDESSTPDVSLDNQSIAENPTNGQVVANSGILNPETGESYTYTLLDDAGGRYEITSGGLLTVKNASLFNFEDQSSHRVRIQATNTQSDDFVRDFDIDVTDVNESPIDLTLDSLDVDEEQPGQIVGNLTVDDPDTSDSFSYSTDDVRFEVVAGQLKLVDGVKLDHETEDSVTVGVTVEDAASNSYEEFFTITVTDVNEAPTNLSLDNSSVDEDASNSFVIGTAGANDVDDGDTLTYSLEKDSFGRFGITSDGDLYVKDDSKLNFENNDSHRIEIKATDSEGEFVIRAFDIEVNDVNEAPTGLNLDNASVNEDASNNFVIGNAIASDEDNGDTLIYSMIDDADGRFGITAAGELFVKDASKIDHEASDSHRVEIAATDSQGESVTKQFDITIGDVNEAPTNLVLSNSSVDEDAPNNHVIGNASANDVDDGDTLTYSLLNDAGGRLGITADGDLFVKDTNLIDHESAESHQVEIEVTDSQGEKISKLFDIDINDVNEEPTGLSLSNSSVDEDAPNNFVIGNASASDEDLGDNLTFSLLDDADGRFGITAGGDLFVKDASQIDHESDAKHQVEIEVTDSQGEKTSKLFDIDINDVNEAPTSLNLNNSSVNEDASDNSVIGNASANDVDDGDTLTYSLLNDAGGRFGITADGDLFVKDTNLIDHESAESHQVEIEVTDSQGEKISKLFDIDINDVNEAPFNVVLDNDSVDEDAPDNFVIGKATANDVDDGDTLTYSLAKDSFGRFGITADGDLYVKDASKLDFEHKTSHRIEIQVTDSGREFVIKKIDVQINDVNEAPEAGDDFYSIDEDTSIVIRPSDLLGNDSDPEGGSLAITGIIDPDHGTLTANGDGTYTYTPDEHFHGLDQFMYEVSDPEGNVSDGIVSITVRSVNDKPIAHDDDFTLDEGTTFNVSSSVFGNDIDVDGETLTGAVVNGPEHGELTWNSNGTFRYEHDGSENHSDQFQYRVVDGSGETSIATVNLDITPVNDAPVAVGETMETEMSTPLTISPQDLLANDSDAEGDNLTLHIKRLPRHGSIEIVDGKLVYTPDPGFVGTDRIKYYVSDGTDNSKVVKLKITVNAAPIPQDSPADNESPGFDDSPEESPDSPTNDNDPDSPTDGNDGRNEVNPGPKAWNNQGFNDFEEDDDDELKTGLVQDEEDNSYQFEFTTSEHERYETSSRFGTVGYRTVEVGSSLDYESESNPLSVFQTNGNTDYNESVIFDNMSRELDSFNRDFKVDGAVDQVTYATLSSITSALTVGYVLWMVRGGMLMASFVSSLPAWQSVDPLNIVDFGMDPDAEVDGESLESMVQQFSTDG